MNLPELSQAKEELNKTIDVINKCLKGIQSIENDLPEMTKQQMTDAFDFLVYHTEKLALSARRLPLDLGIPPDVFDSSKAVCDAFDFQAGFTERGWFIMKIPPLVKKKRMFESSYIKYSVYDFLFEFFREHPLPENLDFGLCDVIFVNVASRNTNFFRLRDNDNLEYNHVTNALATYFLPDDNPLFCNRHQMTYFGDDDHTLVFLVPHSDLHRFLENFDKGIISYKTTCELPSKNSEKL